MNSSKPKSMEVVLLQLGFCILLFAAHCAPATAGPGSSECQRQCGDVEIPYPFGIGTNCSMSADFDVTCQPDQNGVSKPSIGGSELLNISLTSSTIRVLSNISYYCYNDTWRMNSSMVQTVNGNVSVVESYIFTRNPSFRFSNILNKFTVIGCNTLGIVGNTNNSDDLNGCFSMCGRNLSDQTDGSCSGMGCCQTDIPRGMDIDGVALMTFRNTSQIWRSSGHQCSYAMVTETAAFNFSPTYINTTKFLDMGAGRAPAVLDWSIRNQTCQEAKQNLTGTYACRSTNSLCVDSNIGPGYVCNCSQGYGDNPYLPDGCKDVNECLQGQPCPSDSICHNTVGGYRCSCRAGRKYSPSNNTCNPDTHLIVGVTVGFIALMFLSFCGYMIRQKRKQKKS